MDLFESIILGTIIIGFTGALIIFFINIKQIFSSIIEAGYKWLISPFLAIHSLYVFIKTFLKNKGKIERKKELSELAYAVHKKLPVNFSEFDKFIVATSLHNEQLFKDIRFSLETTEEDPSAIKVNYYTDINFTVIQFSSNISFYTFYHCINFVGSNPHNFKHMRGVVLAKEPNQNDHVCYHEPESVFNVLGITRNKTIFSIHILETHDFLGANHTIPIDQSLSLQLCEQIIASIRSEIRNKIPS